MRSGERLDGHRITGLVGSAGFHVLLLIVCLKYWQGAPEILAPEPPIEVTFIPPPMEPIPLDKAREDGPLEPETSAASRPEVPKLSPLPSSTALPIPSTPVPIIPVAPTASQPSSTGTGTTGARSGTGVGASATGARGAGDGGTYEIESWVREATPDDWALFYPQEAKSYLGRVDVTLVCQVTPQQRVQGCRVQREKPNGYGFGDAVVRMSRVFRVKPVFINGEPRYDLKVRIRLVLDPPPAR